MMRRPQVKLDNLIAVIEVAEKRDFERAAKELGLTASAVRKQVEALEVILGAALFDGKKGSLSLTNDGELFHADAVRSVEYALLAEEKVQARLALRNYQLFIGHSTYLPPQLISLVTRLG
jgi:DNA-binding transcriptional LysR family regulator